MFFHSFIPATQRMLRRRAILRAFPAVLALSVVLLTSQVRGQVTTAEILGIATDPSGAAIPGAHCNRSKPGHE